MRVSTTLQDLCQPTRPWRHTQVFASGVDAICAQQFLQEVPPHSRRCFDSSSTPRCGEDHWTPAGSRSKWGHRGLYETHRTGLPRPALETRHDISGYWAGNQNQHPRTNRLYHRMRIGAVQQELSRRDAERFLAPGNSCVPHADWFHRDSSTVHPNAELTLGTRATMVYGGCGKSVRVRLRMEHI